MTRRSWVIVTPSRSITKRKIGSSSRSQSLGSPSALNIARPFLDHRPVEDWSATAARSGPHCGIFSARTTGLISCASEAEPP